MAGGFSTQNNEHLIRSSLWSTQIKKVLDDDLMGTTYVRMITDFPDGDTLNIPSIGQAEVLDYVEGNAIQYTAFDTGNYQFSINKYKSSATWITNKMKQDSFYMNELVSQFVPGQARALAQALENDVMAIGPSGQVASNANAINGVSHRFIGSGTNGTIDVVDFQNASYALQQANVPLVNLVAIVHPSVWYALSTQTNLVNFLSPVQQWNSIVSDGSLSGMKFKANVFGWDVYVSNYLVTGLTDSINNKTASAGVANLFFSAASDLSPFIGLIKQPPKVESEYNKDFQREEYVTTMRYGFGFFRPENFVCVITNTDQVSF